MKGTSKEIKLAIIAILAVTIIYFGIIFLKGLKIFSSNASYYVEMTDISGVDVSSNILANGLKVGYVKAITYNPQTQHLVLEMSVSKDFQIPQGSSVYVSKEMLGAAKLNIAMTASTNAPLQPGDTIKGDTPSDLMSTVGEMVPQVQNLLPKIDSILTALNTLASSPALQASLQNIQQTTANLSTASGHLNTMLQKDIPVLMGNANHVLANADQLTANLASIDIKGIAANADQTLANMNGMTQKLNCAMNSKDNSLGMLLNDSSIALHIDTTIINASLLLQDLKENPKRYVHFSLFGKKQK